MVRCKYWSCAGCGFAVEDANRDVTEEQVRGVITSLLVDEG